jgi:hypothetical protein
VPSEITVFQEIDWEPQPVLQPGMDHHAGVTYFTVPLMRRTVKAAKKKGEEPTLEKVMDTYVVTSEREGFWYEKETLELHNYQMKDQFMQDHETRWSYESVKNFLDGKTSAPTGKDLYSQIRAVYTKYVEFASEIYHDLMTLYVLYTYVFRLFESTGYIHFNGTAASGKSRNLSILNELAFNTIWASSMSPASLYRKLAGSPGTTCIDETEGFEGERGEELRRILNSGYKNGSLVYRTEKGADDRFRSIPYDVFGPKVLASINQLEPVIQSRSIVVAMRPAIRELPDFLTSNPAWEHLRDLLYLWAMENTDALATLVASWWDDSAEGKKARLCPKLIGRQWETTSQFIILADFVGGESLASTLISFFNEYFAKQQEAMDATDRIRTTLRCLPRVLATKAAHPGHLYSVKDIHEVVSSYMEADATEYFKTKHVAKNLGVLGFNHKVRATGGIRIQLEEEAVRHEFRQRRVEPFEEDNDWLEGNRTYQSATTIFEVAHETTHKTDKPFWETDSDDFDPEALLRD